jgi:hypothetical protein
VVEDYDFGSAHERPAPAVGVSDADVPIVGWGLEDAGGPDSTSPSPPRAPTQSGTAETETITLAAAEVHGFTFGGQQYGFGTGITFGRTGATVITPGILSTRSPTSLPFEGDGLYFLSNGMIARPPGQNFTLFAHGKLAPYGDRPGDFRELVEFNAKGWEHYGRDDPRYGDGIKSIELQGPLRQ